MILIRKDYSDLLKRLTEAYDVPNILYADDVPSWAEQKSVQLAEPHQPLTIVNDDRNGRVLVIQSELDEGRLHDVITNAKLRRTLRDNVSDTDRMFDSVRKQLAYCFLKECARLLEGVGGDGIVEDDWVMKEMDRQGFFRE